jgi:excisionase family DNA binding protein
MTRSIRSGEPRVSSNHEASVARQARRILAPLARHDGDVKIRVCGDGLDTATLTPPENAVHLLVQVLDQLARDDAVTVVAHQAELITREAANLFGVSRQVRVGLIEQGEIPFCLAGSHRRVRLDH